jgi:hypothetical protein
MFRSGDFNDQGNFIMFRRLHQLALSAVIVTAGLVSELSVAKALAFPPLTTPPHVQTSEVVAVQLIPRRRIAPLWGGKFSATEIATIHALTIPAQIRGLAIVAAAFAATSLINFTQHNRRNFRNGHYSRNQTTNYCIC